MINTRNYTFKFTTYNCILLILGMEMCCGQESPCPRVFRYEYDRPNHLFGIITVPTPTYHDGFFKLDVNISIGNTVSQNLDKLIQFLGTIEDITNKRPLVFKLEFPFWNNIPPKITYIAINDQSLCVGEPLVLIGHITITTVHLYHNITLTSGNSGNNNPTRKINSNYLRNPPITYNNYPPGSNSNQVKPHVPIVNTYDPSYYNHQPVKSQTPFDYSSTISSTSKNQVNNLDSCGKPMSSNHLIANGMDVEEGAHPWAGALFLRQKTNPKFLCGASLITKKFALTAAHCVSKYSNANLHLVFGRINILDWFNDNSQMANVEKIELHPDYNENTSDADIAILQLSKELTFTSTVSPVCLWETDSDLKRIVNETGVVIGWGQNENYQTEQNLQQLYIPVVSEEACLRSADEFNNITSSRTFCAGRSDNSISGPCNGDSGSGFYFNLGGTWTIRGIVSRSLLNLSGRCNFKKYAVYLDVAKYTQWIHKFL